MSKILLENIENSLKIYIDIKYGNFSEAIKNKFLSLHISEAKFLYELSERFSKVKVKFFEIPYSNRIVDVESYILKDEEELFRAVIFNLEPTMSIFLLKNGWR